MAASGLVSYWTPWLCQWPSLKLSWSTGVSATTTSWRSRSYRVWWQLRVSAELSTCCCWILYIATWEKKKLKISIWIDANFGMWGRLTCNWAFKYDITNVGGGGGGGLEKVGKSVRIVETKWGKKYENVQERGRGNPPKKGVKSYFNAPRENRHWMWCDAKEPYFLSHLKEIELLGYIKDLGSYITMTS